MKEILGQFEDSLKRQIESKLISSKSAELFYWLVSATMEEMTKIGDKIEPELEDILDRIRKAYELSNADEEDSTLEELEVILRKSKAIEPKFKAPSDILHSTLKGFDDRIISDGCYYSLRDPFDTSIFKP